MKNVAKNEMFVFFRIRFHLDPVCSIDKDMDYFNYRFSAV